MPIPQRVIFLVGWASIVRLNESMQSRRGNPPVVALSFELTRLILPHLPISPSPHPDRGRDGGATPTGFDSLFGGTIIFREFPNLPSLFLEFLHILFGQSFDVIDFEFF